MLRARAHVRKAEFLEGTADRYLVEIDIEAFLDDASEVDATPPHHAIHGRIGSAAATASDYLGDGMPRRMIVRVAMRCADRRQLQEARMPTENRLRATGNRFPRSGWC